MFFMAWLKIEIKWDWDLTNSIESDNILLLRRAMQRMCV